LVSGTSIVTSRPDLRDWLRLGAMGMIVAELMARAEDRLREWRVMLPGSSTLDAK
jgi:hypothetical protein